MLELMQATPALVIRVPVRSGRTFRAESHPSSALVTPDLAAELERVLERFAAEANGSCAKRIRIFFKPGIFGHHKVGRAADIYAVGGAGIDVWKRRWDDAVTYAERAPDVQKGHAILDKERQ